MEQTGGMTSKMARSQRLQGVSVICRGKIDDVLD